MGSARADDGYPPLRQPPLDLMGSDVMPVTGGSAYAPPRPLRWSLPVFAGLLAAAWLGGAAWLTRDALPAMSWPAVFELAAAVVIVPILLAVLWLLLGRTSRAQARRFAATSAGVRAEVAMLERTIGSLTGALDRQRGRLAEQTREFAALGDEASGKLAHVGGDWTIAMTQAQRHAAALAATAQDAEASLGVLIASLPRAQAETADLAERLHHAGGSASQAASTLDLQVAALAEQAHGAERLANAAAAHLADQVARVRRESDAAAARLATVADEMTGAVDAVLGRTAQALDTSRRGIAAQGEAMLATVGAHQVTLDGAARASADALATRMEMIELVVERIAKRLDAQRTAGAAMFGELETGIARTETRLDTLHDHGAARAHQLAASIDTLGGSATAMTERLRLGDAAAHDAIGTAEALLLALDANAREIDETLPASLARLDERVTESRRVVAQAKPDLLSLAAAADSTHDMVETIAGLVAGQRSAMERLAGMMRDTLAAGRGEADALGTSMDDTIARAHRFADDAAPRLLDALLRVRDTANAAADKARSTLEGVIPETADRLARASEAALARAVAVGVDRQVTAIGEAADTAVTIVERASDRLGERLRELSNSTALIDTRLVNARAERDEAERDGFARRVSTLIEQLNAASINLTRTFAPEVSDSAWAAYLKGDRGVFTRRAVRLLGAGQAREVRKLYHERADFRDGVDRYVLDFEAMLRAVLAHPEGSPLGVTLLSSDMGKLYVALAQAIERLR